MDSICCSRRIRMNNPACSCPLKSFCRSSREKMISSILEKDISNQEKMYRLLSLENEIDNEELCDFSIRTDDMEEAVEQVKQLLSIEKIDRK